MTYHKYDPQTGLYLESVESETPVQNAVSGILPDLTEYYTVARRGGSWASVLRPEFEIDNGNITLKKEFKLVNGKVVRREEPSA